MSCQTPLLPTKKGPGRPQKGLLAPNTQGRLQFGILGIGVQKPSTLVQARTLTQAETGLQTGSGAASTEQLGQERPAQSPAVVPEQGDTTDAINLADDSDLNLICMYAPL